MMDRTVTVNGFSKSHSMTGYRIGYSAGPTIIAKATGKLQSQMTSCASSIGQKAALAALQHTSPSWFVDRVKELKGKRDLALSLVNSIPHVTCPVPNGAFYLMPEVRIPPTNTITTHTLSLHLINTHSFLTPTRSPLVKAHT